MITYMTDEGDNIYVAMEETDQARQEKKRCVPIEILEAKLDALIQKPGQGETSKPIIQRVPYMLRSRKDFEKYYEPRAIAVGPIHHGKFQPAEELKLELAAHFINECSINECSGKKKEDLLRKIHEEIGKLKECYEEEAINKFSDEELAWILFVDGCAVLHFIHYCAEGKLHELNIRNNLAAFWTLDLFLLENQLPYLALQLLMTSSGRCCQLKESIPEFIEKLIKGAGFSDQGEPTKPASGQRAQPQPEGGEHLLDLLRKRLLGTTSPGPRSPCCTCINIEALCSPGRKEHDWQTFRNARELQSTGIRLRPSKTSSLTDVSFMPIICCVAFLKLPQITVDDSTATKYMNLVALEMCPGFSSNFEITSFIYFLDSLIDTAEDVKALRDERILNNLLGSDEEVAKLFNILSTDLVPNPSLYYKVKKDIQKHYANRWTTWMAQFWNDHFSSPWTILAFIAAIVVLVLTCLQTYYSIHPSNG